MQYNDVVITLLAESSENYIYCYASDVSYEDALKDATLYLIHDYSKREEVFEDVHYDLHRYVIPLNILPINLTKSRKNMSINLDTKVDGTKQSTIIQFFAYEDVNTHLRELTDEFYYMAQYLDRILPTSAEKSVTLRKLLESKDCALRAATTPTN